MRRIFLIISVVLTISFTCCKHEIERCEDLFADMERPELSINSYNSVMNMIVNTTYTYRFNFYDEYFNLYPNPVEHLVGDTFLVCGFITQPDNTPYLFHHNFWHCWIVDDSVVASDPNCSAGGYSIFGDDTSALKSIDISKRCYIKGVLGITSPFVWCNSPGDFDGCGFSCLPFKVISIHN